jgi:hypothetical protein
MLAIHRRSKTPLMCSPRHLATKTLVWLAAILLPLQSFPTAACRCAIANQQMGDSQQRRTPGSSCCVVAGNCRASRGAEDSSCCNTMPEARCNCSCRTTGVCSCRPHNSSPPDPQAPPEDGRQAVQAATQPPAGVSLCVDGSGRPTARSCGARSIACSGFERCITLCRFLL